MNDFISTTILLIIILDPIGISIMLPSLLKGVSPAKMRKVIFREMSIALLILLSFFFIGNEMLSLLGLRNSTLSISGAVVLFLIALGMVFPAIGIVTSSHPFHEKMDSKEEVEPFIVPIAIPLIAGPSSIAIVMLNGAKYSDTVSGLPFIGSIVTAWMISLSTMMFTSKIIKIFGRRGTLALERLIGILLILISVQMFMNGLKDYVRDFSLGAESSSEVQSAE